MLANHPLDRNTTEETVAELVDAVKLSAERRNLLVQLLPEQIPLYEGRSASQTSRIRGYILAAFEQVGLPEEALPYVLEELQSGHDAYLVAAAAKALRGLNKPASWVIPFLLKAVENIKYGDDALTFEHYNPRRPLASYTTALAELFQTFGWLGSHAESALENLHQMYEDRYNEFSQRSKVEIGNAIQRIKSDSEASHGHTCSCEVTTHACCCEAPANGHDAGLDTGIALGLHTHKVDHPAAGSIADVELEDQDGNTVTYAEFFSRKPSIVTFFYTRCNNPNKCSLTITTLARLQKAIKEQGLHERLRTVAITYDPEYDLPRRLKAFGQDRGVSFSAEDRFFRTRSGFQKLREAFELGVNFTGSTVNRHRIELFILDDSGNIAATFSRLQWDVSKVLERAKALLMSD
jgi:protein SCO1/2